METGVRLFKYKEKVNDLSIRTKNTIKYSFPLTSNIEAQTVFRTHSLLGGKDIDTVKKDLQECQRMHISLHISQTV